MDTSKRIFLIFVVVSLTALPFLTMAQGGLHESTNLNILSIGVSITNAIWIVFTIIAVIAFIVAGIIFLTAFGDAEKVRQARSAVIWGVVGIIVAILAYGITNMIRVIIGA